MRLQKDQVFEAALEQWTPLIEKISFKAAQRAAGMKHPMDVADFRQELSACLDRALKSYDPDRGVKFITFFWSACYKEVNKLLRVADANAKIAPTYSSDTFWNGEGDEGVSVWETVEDDSERSAENLYMDAELVAFVRSKLSTRTRCMFDALTGNHPIVTQQLLSYNAGVEQEAAAGGIRRLSLDMNLAFVCKLFGIPRPTAAKMGEEIQATIHAYGVNE